MRRAFAVVPLLLAGCVKAYMYHVPVTHRVRCITITSHGSPAADARVEVFDGQRRESATTDAQGNATIELSYGGCHAHRPLTRCRMFYPSAIEVRAGGASRRIQIADRYAGADHDVELRVTP